MANAQPDRIAEIAADHDLDRETVRSIVEALQDGADNPQVCERCGRAHNADADVYVARVPLDEHETGARCAECYTEHVDDVTTLSARQAEAVAWLLVSPLTYGEIGSLTGMGSPSKNRSRAIEKYEQAQNSHDPGPIVPIMEALINE